MKVNVHGYRMETRGTRHSQSVWSRGQKARGSSFVYTQTLEWMEHPCNPANTESPLVEAASKERDNFHSIMINSMHLLVSGGKETNQDSLSNGE